MDKSSRVDRRPYHRRLRRDPDYRSAQAAQKRQRGLERREEINLIKLREGCMTCGYRKCSSALEFHHRSGEQKSFNIAHSANHKSLFDLVIEIFKCDVLCANCHRELHATE